MKYYELRRKKSKERVIAVFRKLMLEPGFTAPFSRGEADVDGLTSAGLIGERLREAVSAAFASLLEIGDADGVSTAATLDLNEPTGCRGGELRDEHVATGGSTSFLGRIFGRGHGGFFDDPGDRFQQPAADKDTDGHWTDDSSCSDDEVRGASSGAMQEQRRPKQRDDGRSSKQRGCALDGIMPSSSPQPRCLTPEGPWITSGSSSFGSSDYDRPGSDAEDGTPDYEDFLTVVLEKWTEEEEVKSFHYWALRKIYLVCSKYSRLRMGTNWL